MGQMWVTGHSLTLLATRGTWQQHLFCIFQKLEPPEVEVHCLHGIGVSTPGALVYTSDKVWYDYQPTVISDDGDGTVNRRSLHGCLRWDGKQSAPVHHREFNGTYAEHLQLLQNPEVMEYIASVVNSS